MAKKRRKTAKVKPPSESVPLSYLIAKVLREDIDKQLQDRLLFDKNQYDFLRSCAEKGKAGIAEWNEWREANPDEDILLGGSDLSNLYLEGIHLDERYAKTGQGIEDPTASRVHLEMANLTGANLNGANLRGAHLELAYLCATDLEGAVFFHTNLIGATLAEAGLKDANFDCAKLQRAEVYDANLENANFHHSNLESATFQDSVVNGRTSFLSCHVDRETDFRNMGLGAVRIEPGTRTLLQYNIRRMNWEEWYGEHPKLTRLVKGFWWISDYELSTWRIVVTFFGIAFIFASVYYFWGIIAPPGIVTNLFLDESELIVPSRFVPVRALYFSIVTMTTLGFGDMYAYACSFCGHVFLSFQVILGYVLLGALVTRFATLFSAEGPAGKFSEWKIEERLAVRR